MSMKGFNIDDYEPVDNTSPVSQGLKGLDLSEWEPVEDSAPSAKATQPLAKKAPEEEGLLKEFGKAGMRGAYGVGEMFGNLAKFVDYDTGKAITDWANKGADEYAMGKESSESFVKRGVLGGVESMPASVAAGAPGALAGATIGSFGGPLGTWLGGAIGYGASGGTVMGLAEYQNYLDEYRKATGKDPDFNAKSMAVLSALAEGGFEGISNFLEGLTLGAGRGVVRPAATTLKEILKTPLKSWAKRFVAIEGIESATEAATAYSQALTRQAEGLPTMEPLEAAKEAILPAMTMGGMFTLGGAGLTRLHRRNMEKNLTDPSVAPQDRAKAVDYIADLIDVEYGDIGRVDTGTVDGNGNPIYRNEIADLWRKYGIERILAGEPINLDFMVDRISLEAELLQSEIRHDLDLSPEDLGETAGTGTVDEATAEAEEAATTIPQTPVEDAEKTPTLLSSTEEIVKAREETGDETTLQLGKEEETETAAKVLKVYPDKENNIEVHVAKVDKGYSVAIKDLDSGDFFDEVKIYPTEEEANKAAKAIAEGKKSPSVESKPEDTTKVSPEPEKTPQEATGVKPEEVKGEESEQKRTVSDDMKDGKITTLSGRVLTPPTIRISTDRKATKDSKRADEWLRKEAIQEAKNRNDDYVLTLFRGTTPANLSQSDREFMHDYLFGEEKKIFVLEEEKPGTKTKGVIDNGEGMQETEGTEGQIKPATEEGATTPTTPPKKPKKAAPSSSKKKPEPQAELREITTRRKEPADPAVLDAFKKALADPSEENMEALVAHAKRFEEWQYDEKGKKRKNVGYRKFKEALGEIPGVSYPEWKTLGSQSATDFWNGIRFVPGVKPTTTPLGEEFIPESEIDSIIKTADNNIQGIKEELYEDGYSESEVKEIIEGLTKELESEVSGRTAEEILAELKEAVKAARIEVKQPTEETKTETPEPEDGWRDHLIKARKYALDLGITKEQVSNWNSVESIVEAVDKRLSGEETTKDPNRKLVKAFKTAIDKGQPKDKNAVLKVAAEALGIDQGKAREELNQRYREIEEAYEYALVQKAGEIAKDGSLSSGEKFEQIKRLYDEQPLLLERTSTSTEKQQFSTPLPLAYLMSEATGITTNSKVADLAGAGNGALLIGTNPKNTTANELDTGSRSEHLKESGYTVLNYDAREDVPDNLKKSQDVIVINPPFKAMEPVEYDGYRIGKLEHLLALKSLEAMKDDGRAAIIIGGHNFKDGKKMITADRTFFNYLYSRYNVRYNVDIDGEVYRRQGTTFPIRLLVVDGRKTTVDPDAFAPTKAEQVQSAGTFDEVREVLGGNALSMASQEAEGIRQTEREGNVPEGVGEGGTERVDRPEGQRDQDNERDRGHDTSGREGPLPGDGGSGEEGLRPDNVPGGHESPGINIFDASKKEELRKKILEKLGKTEKGKKAPDELFDTSGQFTLSGNQPTTEPKKMTVPEKKGERLLDVEKQDVDQLRDRLTEGQKAPQKPVKIFDESKKDELKKRIKERLNRQSMNPILDPGLYVDAVHLGGIYVQEGLNNFAAWSKQMVKDLGEAVNPMLKSVWATLTHYPTQHKKDFVRLHGATKGSLFWTTDLKKALSRQIGKFSASTGVKIEIIQNNYGFPRDFIERAGGSLDVENDVIRGAYDSRTNTVYIVADGIDSVKTAEHVIIEEIVGHKGLKALLKPLEMSMVRLSVYDQFKDTPMMRELAREYGFDTDTLTGRAMAGNEFMVHHMPSIYEKPTIMNKLTSFIRRALRKIGFTVQYSEADIRVLMNRAWENMRGDKAQLKGEGGIFLKKDLGGEDQKMIDMSPEFSKTVNANSEKAASPEEAYHKSKSFKELLKESMTGDIGWFKKYFYNPFFKGQKIPAWKKAVDISENRREKRTELNHQYFGMSRDFYGLQGESLRKLEKILIEGDATLPYKHADMLKEAKTLKEGGNLEGAREMREKARELRALNRYSDEELKEGVTVEGGEKIVLSDKEIEIYKSIRSMFERMHNDWYVNQMNLLLRRYENESWFKPFVDIYSQRDVTPEMAKLWKTINRFAFNNYKGKKDKTIQKKRQADIAVLADHFGDTITAADLVNMAKAYRDNISTMNQIRKARNRLGKWIAYFPRVRGKGKYYLNVYEVTKDVNEETGEETERRSLIFNTTFRNAQEGEKLEKEILSELKGTNVAVELGEVKRESEQSFVGASDMNLQRLLDNAISRMKGAKGVDPDTLKSIKGSMIQAISNELKARGFAQHSIRRKWKLIKGYETTGLQKVLRDYITGFTGMSTKQEAAIDFLDLMQTIDRKQTNLYEDISKYARDMLRNQEALDRISGKARGYAFIWYLGANIRPMLLQLTQNYVTGMPFLKEKMREWGVKGASEKLYHKAMIDAARTKIDSTTGEVKGKALNKWEKQMIKEMLAKGIAEDQYIQEITGQMRSKVGRAYDKALYYLSYPFSQMEIFNRKSAGLAMFRIAWDKYSDTIKNEEDRYRKAFEEAKEYIYKTHYAYGKENLPRIATGGDVASIGSRTALTFRSFTHNYLLSLINSGDWKTIAHSLAYVAVFGGLLGLPLIGDILDLLEKWTGKSYKKSAREVLRKFGGRTLETFGMHGLPALAGANISGSMAIGIPFVGETPADTVYGVMGGLAQKGKLAVQSLGRGDVYRALENAAPEFVANPMKAYRMATTGATTQRGKRLFDEHGRPVKLSASEAAIKTVGFNPSEYSAKNEAQRSASNIQEYFSDWKTNIYESYRVARLNHNVKAQNDAMKEIRKFNQAVREKGAQDLVSLIKLSNVVKAARERQTKKQRRESRFKRDYVGG